MLNERGNEIEEKFNNAKKFVNGPYHPQAEFKFNEEEKKVLNIYISILYTIYNLANDLEEITREANRVGYARAFTQPSIDEKSIAAEIKSKVYDFLYKFEGVVKKSKEIDNGESDISTSEGLLTYLEYTVEPAFNQIISEGFRKTRPYGHYPTAFMHTFGIDQDHQFKFNQKLLSIRSFLQNPIEILLPKKEETKSCRIM